MAKVDLPVAVYSGHNAEAVFLKSLLEGSGISASISDFSIAGHVDFRVYVAQRDVERARPIIDDFSERGNKTQGF
jgi:hypothetical protein